MPGVEVDHAGRRWRVHRALGPDAVLLTNDAGEIVSAAPARVELATQIAIAQPPRAPDERRYTDAQWAEAARRRDLLTELARRPRRNRTQVNDVAQELGVKRRRVYALLGSLQAGGDDVAVFLPKQGKPRTKRLAPAVEAIIKQATDEHYAQANRPPLLSLHKTVAERCAAAGVPTPLDPRRAEPGARSRSGLADPAAGGPQGRPRAAPAHRRPPWRRGALGAGPVSIFLRHFSAGGWESMD